MRHEFDPAHAPSRALLRAVCAGALIAATASCGGGGGDAETERVGSIGGLDLAPPAGTFRNVVVVCLDCLRPDHLGAYGYDERDASPWIDELATRSVVFDSAWAASSWTKSSVPSYMTGLQPAQHGVYVGVLFGEMRQLSDRLPEPAISVAEAFQDAGFDTAGLATNAQISDEFGFDQGFEHYVYRHATNAEMAEEAASWLRNRDDYAPYFLYLHVTATHWPYRIPDEYKAMYSTPEAVSRVRVDLGSDWVKQVNRREVERDEEMTAAWIALYDGSLRYSDDVLSKLAEVIEAEDGGRDTVICVISDHGEDLFEYGNFGHGGNLRNQTLQVPWILHVPGVEPTRVKEHVTLAEMPTRLLQAAGLDPAVMPEPERPPTDGAIFSELSMPYSYQQAWIRDEHKLVRTFRASKEFGDRLDLGAGRMRAGAIRTLLGLGVDGAREAGWRVTDRLYRLDGRENDPIEDEEALATRLGAELEAYGTSLLGVLQEAAEAEINPERMRELQELGYTGK